MNRLHLLHSRAMGRNLAVLTLVAAAYEQPGGDNAARSRHMAAVEDREAQFDIEGVPCWRDAHARRPT